MRRGVLSSQSVDKLLQLVAFAFDLLVFLLGDFLVELAFVAGFVRISHAPVELCEPIVGLVGKRRIFDRLLKQRNSFRPISLA